MLACFHASKQARKRDWHSACPLAECHSGKETCLPSVQRVCHSASMLISIINQKGGVGKTTLAVHLAVWHFERGRRVAFIDADGQSSSSKWIAAAEPAVTLVRATDADAIIESAQVLRETHEVIVADGPANLADSTRALLLVADFAVVPCGGSMPELESSADTIRILRNAQAVRPPGLPPAIVALGRLRNDRCHLTREAPQAAGTLGLPVCRHVLRLREALADAPGQRTVVWRMGYRARAAARELHNLITEVMTYGDKATKHNGDPHGGTAGVPSSGQRPGDIPAEFEPHGIAGGCPGGDATGSTDTRGHVERP